MNTIFDLRWYFFNLPYLSKKQWSPTFGDSDIVHKLNNTNFTYNMSHSKGVILERRFTQVSNKYYSNINYVQLLF